MILELFDQMLNQNALMGKCKKPPLDEAGMLDLARGILQRAGEYSY